MNPDHPHSPLIDKLIYFGGIAGPLATLPQVLKIWINKDATGVSITSWAAYAVGSAFWIWYGLQHKQRPLVFAYSLFFIIEALIIVGTFLYGNGF